MCILFSINQDEEDRALMRKPFHGPMTHTAQVHATNIGDCIRGMFPTAENERDTAVKTHFFKSTPGDEWSLSNINIQRQSG